MSWARPWICQSDASPKWPQFSCTPLDVPPASWKHLSVGRWPHRSTRTVPFGGTLWLFNAMENGPFINVVWWFTYNGWFSIAMWNNQRVNPTVVRQSWDPNNETLVVLNLGMDSDRCCSLHQIHADFTRDLCWFSMVFPWFFHGFSMGFPLNFAFQATQEIRINSSSHIRPRRHPYDCGSSVDTSSMAVYMVAKHVCYKNYIHSHSQFLFMAKPSHLFVM